MATHGKKYEAALALVDRERLYDAAEAIALVKQTATAQFDETVEVHIRTTSDPRQADQLIRGVALLPNGLGKPVRVLVFGQGDVVKAAMDAGADRAGGEELIPEIEGGWTEFDVAIATPDMMGRIGRLGRVLGRRGLMPNPRTGTVVQAADIARAVTDAKKGRVEFRMDKTAIIHAPIGKAGFSEEKLLENLTALIDAINQAKPAGIKGPFVKSIYLTSTMGPGIKLDTTAVMSLKVA